MKKLLHIAFLLLLCVSCVRETVAEYPEGEEGLPVDVELFFGPVDAQSVTISTRSTLGVAQESRVNNMFVFIFDANGKKIYGHFFDGSNYGQPEAGGTDWWEVTNITSESQGETHGTIHLKTITKNNCTIVGIANINVDMLAISLGQLSATQKLSDLEAMKVTMNQTDIESSGFFMMTGRLDGVNITRDPDAETQRIEGTLIYRRLNAKIQFNVRVAPGSPISSFQMTKWELVNEPITTYLLERGTYISGDAPEDAASVSSDFIRTGELNYETETVTNDYYSGSSINKIVSYGFSFYMMENRFAPLAEPRTYEDRDRQQKLNEVDRGPFSKVDNGPFIYADPRSAYVIIHGNLQMDASHVDANGTLSADVQYIIHLGDFTKSVSDFNIYRNHNYIFNISIYGVNDIVAEVDANYDPDPTQRLNEPEPGATGKVVVALEEVYTCDSHYTSHVVSFHANTLDTENVTWYVETPFNPEGASPTVIDGYEYTEGVDYEWVEFRVNEMGSDGLYKQNRQIYKPRTPEFAWANTMNITELVAYLKEQRGYYEEDLDHMDDPSWTRKSDFDNETLENGGPKISVTAFVNEYYYEVEPLEHRYIKDLWKQFVNKPMRCMHILSRSRHSADGESTSFGAAVTIQQKSIQSIYNINYPDLQSAWGVETEEDELESGATLYMPGWSRGKSPTSEDRGNTSISNGRMNTMKEWKMLDKNGNEQHMGQEGDEYAHWDTYLNLTATNEDILLRKDAQKDYRYLRWSCMSRNRDNNGNGIIDKDEIRWYMGADTQLLGLFLGSYGIEAEARLYQRSAQDQLSNDRNVWRQHVVASTRYPDRSNSDVNARCVWAEEGLCGSDLSFYNTNDGSTDYFSTRCVRNLGYYVDETDGKEKDITFAEPEIEPDQVIQMTRHRRVSPSNDVLYPTGNYDDYVYYDFDCSRVNQASLREPVSHELIAHDENSKAACLYTHFEVIPAAESIKVPSKMTFEGKSYDVQYPRYMNAYLDASWGIQSNPFCPEGYRLPNVREDAIIWNFIPVLDRNYLYGINNHSRTHWSFGVDGVRRKTGLSSWGWSVSKVKILMANERKDDQRASAIRCVRDIQDD